MKESMDAIARWVELAENLISVIPVIDPFYWKIGFFVDYTPKLLLLALDYVVYTRQ